MNEVAKKLEVLANVAIIALALFLGSVFANRYFFGNAKPAEVQVGERVSLPGVDWSKSNRTLVLALQSGCHFCTESAPFYQRFTREVGGQKRIRLVAALPQQIDDGRKYLNDLGVAVDEVKQVSLESLKVAGTPTLLLVNNAGRIENVWRGKLSNNQETEVLSRLQ